MSSDEPADDHDTDRTDDAGADEDIGIEIDVGGDADGDEDDGSDVSARERLEREADKAVSEPRGSYGFDVTLRERLVHSFHRLTITLR